MTKAVHDPTAKQIVSKYVSSNQAVVAMLLLLVVWSCLPEIKQYAANKLGLPVSQEFSKEQIIMQKLDQVLAHESSEDSSKKVELAIAPYKAFAESVNLDNHITQICNNNHSHAQATIRESWMSVLASTF